VPIPKDGTYRAALAKARDLTNGYQAAAVQDMAKALDRTLKRLAAEVAGLPVDTDANRRRALEVTQAAVTEMRTNLTSALTTAIQQNRNVTFSEVLDIQQRASLTAARAADLPDALMGAVRTPSLTQLGAFAMYGKSGADAWKSVASQYVEGATEHVRTIFRAAIAQGASPTHITTWLRPYMLGVQDAKALGIPIPATAAPGQKLDMKALAKLGAPGRMAADRIRYNADRLAYSEIHNARREADATMYAADPLVEAVRWQLASVRGAVDVPDECDGLAHGDFYGMGAGVFPIHAIPLPPHPFDRCDTFPVLRDISLAHTPKPKPNRLQFPTFGWGRAGAKVKPSALEKLAASTLQHVDYSELQGTGFASIATEAVGVVAPPPLSAAKPKARWEVVMSKKVGDAAGSNAGGFYMGDDGVKRYVKFYKDPAQAWNEHVAGQLYRKLGVQVPVTEVFTTAEGTTAFASTIVENVGTVGKLGLNAERARKILDGYTADAFLANWDAVGTGLDNVVESVTGEIIRIDNGGALLYRAQAGLKTTQISVPNLHSWGDLDTLYTKNTYYKSVFDAAGFKGSTDPKFLHYHVIPGMEKIATTFGSTDFGALITELAPGMSQTERTALVDMLAARRNKLQGKLKQLKEMAEPKIEFVPASVQDIPAPPVVVAPPPPTPVTKATTVASKAKKAKTAVGTSTQFPGFLTPEEIPVWNGGGAPILYTDQFAFNNSHYLATHYGSLDGFVDQTVLGKKLHFTSATPNPQSIPVVLNVTPDEVLTLNLAGSSYNTELKKLGIDPYSNTKAQVAAKIKKMGKKVVKLNTPSGLQQWVVLDPKVAKMAEAPNVGTLAANGDALTGNWAKQKYATEYGGGAVAPAPKGMGTPSISVTPPTPTPFTPPAPAVPKNSMAGPVTPKPKALERNTPPGKVSYMNVRKSYHDIPPDDLVPESRDATPDTPGKTFRRQRLRRIDRVDEFGTPDRANPRKDAGAAPTDVGSVTPRAVNRVVSDHEFQDIFTRMGQEIDAESARAMLEDTLMDAGNSARIHMRDFVSKSTFERTAAKIGKERAAKALNTIHMALNDWYSSSNTTGAGFWKHMVSTMDGGLHSTFHKKYVDFDDFEYAFTAQADYEEWLKTRGVSAEDVHIAYDVMRKHHRAFVHHAMGADDSLGLTVLRGVKANPGNNYWENTGHARTERDELAVMMGNSVNSTSLSGRVARNFAHDQGTVFEWVAPLEDIQLVYFLNDERYAESVSGFWGEREIFVRLQPRAVRSYPGRYAHR
jgi:hypothetical protein